jgi:hypothetical protein
LAVVDPDLDADARSTALDLQQVVVDRESRRLRLWRARVALRADGRAGRRGLVQVTSVRGRVVARDAPLTPAEVVGRRDVREQRETLFVAEVRAGLDEPRRVDDERGLPVRLLALDQARDAFKRAQLATPRIS